jgi:hypothetical protein
VGQRFIIEDRCHVQAAITHENLQIFPVASAHYPDTAGFLSLEAGLTSGAVIITEVGAAGPGTTVSDNARVNGLAVINKSTKALILLGGEIVRGGKQDRVVGEDVLVAAGASIPLDVFCVESGRWAYRSRHFARSGDYMAKPSVRARAAFDKDQSAVWHEVQRARESVAARISSPALFQAVSSTTSYGEVFDNQDVVKELDKTAGWDRFRDAVLYAFRDQRACGCILAIAGHPAWAEVFASADLFAPYMAKLVNSFVAESLTSAKAGASVLEEEAEAFLHDWQAPSERLRREPGLFEYVESESSGWNGSQLRSLLPGCSCGLHAVKEARLDKD